MISNRGNVQLPVYHKVVSLTLHRCHIMKCHHRYHPQPKPCLHSTQFTLRYLNTCKTGFRVDALSEFHARSLYTSCEDSAFDGSPAGPNFTSAIVPSCFHSTIFPYPQLANCMLGGWGKISAIQKSNPPSPKISDTTPCFRLQANDNKTPNY